MARGQLTPVLRFLRALAPAHGGDTPDAELLGRFATRRDADAFTALLRRHGPMVLGVCRRLLSDAHDAEDAFQATFLVLVRRAHSLGTPELLGNWLYGVASRIALKAKADAARRRTRERRLTEGAAAESAPDLAWADLRPVLDEEVSRLPARYRAPFVLCYLDGKTNEEAARLLGCPKGTVLSRLAWARRRLRARLTRRGVTLSATLFAAALAPGETLAAVPQALMSSTVRAALLGAAGRAAAAGVISLEVAALTKGVLKAMLLGKLKLAVLFLLAVGLVAAGTGLLAHRSGAAERPRTGSGDTAGTVLSAAVAPGAADKEAAEDSSLNGSGKLITKELDLAGFTSVDVRRGFRVDITQGKAFTVVLTADDNLFEYIKAVKDGSVLKVSLDARNKSFCKATFKVAVTMPTLEKVSLSDACNGTIQGFTAAKDFKANVSDLSTLGGELTATTLEVEVSDASTVTLKGSAKEGKLTARDASHLLLADFALDRADVHLSDASTAAIRVQAKLDYSLSDACRLTYHGDPSLGKKVTSEGSSVTRGNQESAALGGGTPWRTLIADLEKQIPKLMEEARVPGLSIAIIKDAKLFWRRGFGVKDVTSKELVDNDTVFEAASTSKPVFAYAVMKLCEKGVMNLDTPLTKYTPERFLEGDPRLDLITARHVLSHTSGFQNWRSTEEPLKIHFKPGEKWSYSGEGYYYLQSVVTHLKGKVNKKHRGTFEAGLRVYATDIDEYMRTNILAPFGMTSSGYLWNDAMEKQMAPGHDEKGKPTKLNRKPTGPSVARYGAAGGLCTTPTDYAKCLIEVIDPKPSDAFRLKKDSLKEMLRPQVKVNDSISQALGWGIRHTEKGNFIMHGGGNPGYACFVVASVERKSGLVVMTNCDNGYKVIDKLLLGEIIYQFLGAKMPYPLG
jgi:RNA polymerase sigma factor (sigma-70 family)